MYNNVYRIALCTSFIVFLSFFNLHSQSLTQVTVDQKSILDEIFNDYEIVNYDMNAEKVESIRKDGFNQFAWTTPTETLRFESTAKKFRANDYLLRAADDENNTRAATAAPIVLVGHTDGYKENMSLTVNEDFIYGTVSTDDGVYFVEPLRYYISSADKKLFLAYRAEDAKLQTLPDYCAVAQKQQKQDQFKGAKNNAQRSVGGCFEVEVALAGDFSMFQKYGSVTGVENHIIGVLNNVQNNYDDEFADELQLLINEIFVSNCSTCDPWTSSTSAGSLLDSFRSWGNNNFMFSHDIATLWTDRDFDGTTIGIAFVGVVCEFSRYNCCEDFSGSAELLRVVQAHEIGHNFDAGHDSGNGDIMATSVSNTSSWSATSISEIQNHYLSKTCLTSCATAVAPVSSFTFAASGDCAPLNVQYNSTSSGGNLTHDWSFPGGTPSTSTDVNPTILYDTPGNYDATLTVSNTQGTDVSVQTGIINVDNLPTADFSYSIDGSTVTFINQSTGLNLDYFWSFGDGFTLSQEQPIYTYGEDGVYTVFLEVMNDCGTELYTEVITIVTPPTAGFSASNQVVCVGESILYTNQSSSNATDFTWLFEGGAPDVSIDPSVEVDYLTAGVYDVQLTATNAAFEDVDLRVDFVEVVANPVAAFSYTVDGLVVTFDNTSASADSYSWMFDDGTSSSIPNPVHEFPLEGTYTVILEANNAACSASLVTVEITVSSVPQPAFSSNVIAACTAVEVTYDDASTNNPTSWSWTFEGGTPSTSTLENPIVQYAQSGVYDVTLEVANDQGASTMTTQEYITISDAPTADFDITGNGTFVEFANTSVGATSLAWDFGDGGSSTDASPTYNYAAEGIYTVTLTATNQCGVNVSTSTLDLYTVPTASFSSVASTLCVGETISFMNQSSDNVDSYNWTFDGGTPSVSTEANPIIKYNTPGTYSVKLTVSNPTFSNTAIEEDIVVIIDTPTAAPSFTNNGLVYQFDDNTTYGDTYSWDFGDGNTSTDQAPSHTYAIEGTYAVELLVSNACGSASSTVMVESYSAPTAAFSSNVTSGCAPVEITFTNESTANSTDFMWVFDGGSPATSTDESPTVAYAQVGTYDVTLVAMNPLFENTAIQSDLIVVNGVPSGDFDFTANLLDVDFSATSDNTMTYSWDFGDGNTSTASNPAHTYSAEGEYTVTLTLSNACGTKQIENTVTVSFAVQAAFTTENTTGCNPLEVKYTNASTSNASSFSWSFPGGNPSTSTEENVTVIYESAGVYSASLSVTSLNDMNTTTQSDIITVLSAPMVSFNASITGNTITLENTSSDASSIEWDFGDGNKSTDANPDYEYEAGGVYTVTLTASNECGTTAISKDINIVLSNTNEISSIDEFIVYPNPSSGVFFLDLKSSKSTSLNLSVIDLEGRQVYSSVEKLSANLGFTKSFDLPNLAQSTYLLVIQSEDGKMVKKINIVE